MAGGGQHHCCTPGGSAGVSYQEAEWQTSPGPQRIEFILKQDCVFK